MQSDINAVLNKEEVHIVPTSSNYDVQAVHQQLLAMGAGVWNDPNRPHVYLLFDHDSSKQDFLANHTPSTATSYEYPIVPIIEVRPNGVYINLFAGDRLNQVIRPFLGWLLAAQPYRIE